MESFSDFPKAFLQRLSQQLGPEFPEFLAALSGERTHALRVNTLKISAAEFQARSAWPLEPVPWCPSGFYYPEAARPGLHPDYWAGLYYIQEPAALSVGEALAPIPGERVIDLAAAPGGKTSHLAAQMQGRGLLVASEVERPRARALLENLSRSGVTASVAQAHIKTLADGFGAFFDRVLLDAPCSGEGMFRKDPEARSYWQPGLPARMAELQAELIDAAANLVRPGGVLVYSTCTFAPEENEGVVGGFLQTHPEFGLEAVPGSQFFAPGVPEWGGDPELVKTARLWPHRLRGEGHFVARLRREDGLPATPRLWSWPRLARKTRTAWESFAQEHLEFVPDPDRIMALGERLYWIPEGLPETSGIKLLAPGVFLGQLKGERLVPARGLAQWSQVKVTGPQIGLEAGEVEPFFRGAILEKPVPDGWYTLSFDQFPLAFAQAKRGVLRPGPLGF
jgi:NOL1/NOP2/sun family putative RNA methylase